MQNILDRDVIYFLVVSARKNICLHPETVTRNIQSVDESLRGGKLLKNLEIILNE